MGAAENKETIERIYQALSRGDRRPFGDALHPDYVWRLPGHSSWSRCFEGQAAVERDLLTPLFSLFATPFIARAINLIAEGDYVVAEVRGDVMTRRGDRYNNEYCFIFRFRGGKIVEVIEYADTDLEERVLGRYEDALAAVQATPA